MTLISACALSTMITLGIQLIGMHFDNAWKIGCRSFSLLSPMTLKATNMPFYHSSYTIKVYQGNMEQTLCFAFINNDLVITLHSMEEKGIPCFDSFQRLHWMKLKCGFQIFPSFQIAMEFEFQMWMVCHLGSIDLSPKGHVGHNKKPN